MKRSASLCVLSAWIDRAKIPSGGSRKFLDIKIQKRPYSLSLKIIFPMGVLLRGRV